MSSEMLSESAQVKWHCRPEVEQPLRYARRLLAMSPGEVAVRVRERVAPNPRFAPGRWEPPPAGLIDEHFERGFLFGPRRGRAILEGLEAARSIEAARRGLESCTPKWRAGDIRSMWEVNRHQFLFPIARAFALTGEPVYRRGIETLLEDWWAENPAGEGPNWSSALEVAVRAVSWLWCIPLMLGLDHRFLRRWMISLYEHYEYLRTHSSLYLDPTNHLIGEATGLLLLASALPSLPQAEIEVERAMEILAWEIERQVAPDGVGLEQSTGYQRFVLDFYLQTIALCRRTGRPLPPVIPQRVAAMQEFLSTLGGADGVLPSIGDGDDGRGAPVPVGELPLWLDAPDVLRRGSRIFPHGGYCYFETGGMALLFDAGPLGLWPNASHGHADALSILVKLDGRWVLGDPGTGAYLAAPHVRDQLRGTAAHNTITVDGLDQSDALDTFKWLKPAPARLLAAEHDSAVGVHDGYRRLRRPVRHYRSVRMLQPPADKAGWFVFDRLEGHGRHRCALRFHFPPDIAVRFESPQCVVAGGLRICLSEFGARVESGLWSDRFGHWQYAPVLVLERDAELPLTWLTLIERWRKQ